MSPPESMFDGCFQHIEAALNDLKAARAISARAMGRSPRVIIAMPAGMRRSRFFGIQPMHCACG